jgi:hypothetical protein
MKLLTTILAACLLATAAHGQNIGLVTDTNNTIVTSRTGAVVWTNPLTVNSGSVTNNSPSIAIGQTWTGTNPSPLSYRAMTITVTNSSGLTGNTNWALAVVNGTNDLYPVAGFSQSGAVMVSGVGLQTREGPSWVQWFFGGYNQPNSLRAPSLAIGGAGTGFGGIGSGVLTTETNSHVLAIRSATNAQEWRVYGTYTTNTNYRRLSMGMATNGEAFLRPEGAGAGVSNNILNISGIGTTATNGTLWDDNGLVKTTNVVGVPSGSATAGSVSTADGAGGSSFVASRTVTRTLTTNSTRTSWTNQSATPILANVEEGFGTWTLDASSTYRVELVLRTDYAVTNSAYQHALRFSGVLAPQINSVVGFSGVPVTGIAAVIMATNSTSLTLGASGTGARVLTAQVWLMTDTNSVDLTYAWKPATDTTNYCTLFSGSTMSVTKIAP